MFANQWQFWVLGSGLAVLLAGCGPEPPRQLRKRPPDPEFPAAPQATTPPLPTATADAKKAASPTVVVAPGATNQSSGKAPAKSVPITPVVLPELPLANSIVLRAVTAELSQEERLQQAVARLRKITLAMREFVGKEKRFPASPGENLSWRVALLPYLGHEELFSNFKMNEPWDSPTNREAALEIPSVYQSPFRNDGRTTFQVPRFSFSLFSNPDGVPADQFTDPWGETLVLLMVDDELAIEWSKPGDYRLSEEDNPVGRLGMKTQGFLACTADGKVRWIHSQNSWEKLRALFTRSGNEKVEVASALLAPDVGLANLPVPHLAVAASSSTNATPVAVGSNPTVRVASSSTVPSTPADDLRMPVPTTEEMEQAKAHLKIVFQEEIAKTRRGDTKRFKHDLAEELMKNASKVEGEHAAYFVLLQMARDSAATTGDFKLAQQATDKLIAGFQVNDFELRSKTVIESGKALLPNFENQNNDLLKQTEIVLKEALKLDQFDAAKELLEIYAESSRRKYHGKDDHRIQGRSPGNRTSGKNNEERQELQRLQTAEKEIDDMRRAYQRIPVARETLSQSPEDAEANYTLGAYECLVKFNWPQGLPLLAKGSNLRLKVLATEDSAIPIEPERQVELANEYWNLSEQESGLFKRGLQLRAVYWYKQALPKLSNSLHKVQAERRIAEADKTYGVPLVKHAIELMDRGV